MSPRGKKEQKPIFEFISIFSDFRFILGFIVVFAVLDESERLFRAFVSELPRKGKKGEEREKEEERKREKKRKN